MKILHCALLASAVQLSVSVGSSSTGLPPGTADVIEVAGQGKVLGVRADAANLRYWLGVPFAADTAGPNNWVPPVARAPWDFVLDCTAWGAGCLSPHHNADVPKNTSTDCLNLNIFVPARATGPLPVLLFFVRPLGPTAIL